MLKRSLSLLAMLLVMVPMVAFAGSVSMRVMTAGGAISVNNGPDQTFTAGTVTKSYTADATVAIKPADGYVISAVSLNSVSQPKSSPLTVPFKTTSQTVSVSFARVLTSISATATTADGTVSPYGTTSVYAGNTATYTFSPALGKKVEGIKVNDVALSGTGNTDYTLTPALGSEGTIKLSFKVPTTPVTIVGSFVALSANAGAPQTVLVNATGPTTAKLSGSTSAPASVVWTQTSGATVLEIKDGTTLAPTITFPAAGNYGFKLSANDGAAVSTTTVTVAATAADAATNQCVNCHNNGGVGAGVFEKWEASVHGESTHSLCYSCHAGANTGAHPGTAKTCTGCHVPTGPYAVQELTHKTAAAAACVACHTTAGDYHTASELTTNAYTIMHLGGKAAPVKGINGATADGAVNEGDSVTQYLTQGAKCVDCHNSTNSVIKGFAEGGHGAVSSNPLNAFGHYDWKARQNSYNPAWIWGTRSASNCDRCHTAYGFMAFANQTTGMTRLQLQLSQPSAVLICVGCHSNIESGALRTDATPAGNPTPLSGGYFALFSSSASGITAGNTKIQVQFPALKNSSICIPCHSGRTTDKVYIETYAKSAAAGKNYSTLQGSIYQHAANMGQSFIGKGAYDFSGKLANIGATGHVALKNGDADTQGPCVGCHHTKPGASHSLEVVASEASCVAAQCHPTVPNVEEAEANFNAAVAALDKMIRTKFAPLLASGNSDLAAERAGYWRFGRFGKAAGQPADLTTATRAYGAWSNWQLLTVWDKAAFVHNPIYARQVLNDTIGYLATAKTPTEVNGRENYSATTINNNIATYAAAAGADVDAAKAWVVAPGCESCHANKVEDFNTAGGYHAGHGYACARCHTEKHQTTPPNCNACHGQTTSDAYAGTTDCAKCHASKDVHTMAAADLTKGCIDCHDVAIAAHEGAVNDNNGVRAIMPEFGKRSHHITGGTPTNEQCVVCHAEGMASAGKAVIDPAYHMKDNKTYLRNVDGGAPFAWDGSNHGDMDNFCFACHDVDGAADIATIQAFLPAATAKNPFADSLTNGYDQVQRAGVVDVKSAFTATNASHHAVSAPRYKYKFSTRENADNWSIKNGGQAGDIPASQIAEEARKAGDATLDAWDEEEVYDENGPEHGGEATLFEAGKFVSTYTPLGASESVADNSQLHCGDCHTVGQFKANASTNADGSQAAVAIGAHGSANEYMLRNSAGTDALHTPRTLVCFNCHKTTFPEGNATAYNQITGYATAHSVSAFHGQCIADSMIQVGVNRLTNSEQNAYNKVPYVGWATADGMVGNNTGSGNITGISCTNCHNSGLRSGWGGIHGGDNTYTDGLGRSQKTYRFMPGMGNYRYAPPGGWDGKDHTDPSLETVEMSGVGAGKAMGGCYTGTGTTGGDPNAGYSACNHHTTSSAQKSQAYMDRITVVAPNVRTGANYGGGTASTPTAAEPTVREATGGNTLVTRPLKY